MNPLQRLAATIQERLPNAAVSIESPMLDTGIWFLDIEQDGHDVVAQWKHDKGFGLSCSREYHFGEGCDEAYASLQTTYERAEELLVNKSFTSSAYALRETP